jgi:F-type H+-transporting ATPase subunit b
MTTATTTATTTTATGTVEPTTGAVTTAADAATTAAGHGAEAAGHGGGGLPQLNPDVFEPQLFWLALTFALLYFLMSRVVIPRIGGVIEERKNRIARDLAEADRLKTETKQAVEAYEQAIAEAKGSAHKIAQETRDKLKSEVDAERSRIEKDLNDKSVAAEGRIAKAKSDALAQVGGIAAETAESIIGQLIGAKVNRNEALAAVEAVRRR